MKVKLKVVIKLENGYNCLPTLNPIKKIKYNDAKAEVRLLKRDILHPKYIPDECY